MADRALDNHEIKCKVCGELKQRIRKGKFGRRTPKWVGVDGKLWNGLCCGVCHLKQVAVRQSIKRLINAE